MPPLLKQRHYGKALRILGNIALLGQYLLAQLVRNRVPVRARLVVGYLAHLGKLR